MMKEAEQQILTPSSHEQIARILLFGFFISNLEKTTTAQQV